MTIMDTSPSQIPPAPIAQKHRYASLDILRGFAVLAIFIVNIKGIAMPLHYYSNASLWTASGDMMIACFQAMFIDNNGRTIFTALFGAGLILMTDNIEKRGGNAIIINNRRLAWLLFFGLIHINLIWFGDILTIYALAGFLTVFFWHAPIEHLKKRFFQTFVLSLIWIAVLNLAAVFLYSGEIKEFELEAWRPTQDIIEDYKTIYLGSITDQISDRLATTTIDNLLFIISGRFLETISIIIAGMILWKNGFLRGDVKPRSYILIAFISLVLMVTLNGARLYFLSLSEWNFVTFIQLDILGVITGPLGALGYSALIIFLIQSGIKFTLIANTGRMAFTNYIVSSLIGTTIFYGHGFGLYASSTLKELMGIVLLTWIFLIFFSNLWLHHFRYGPLEWLWRSLTYRKIQPFKKG